ncbi:MAG: hypothetical protein ACRDCB_10220 [Clostridium sp.]
MIKNNAFFQTIDCEVIETIDLFIGIIELYSKENLYSLYLAQVNAMCLNNSFITFKEYLDKLVINNNGSKKNKNQVFEESLSTLKKIKEGFNGSI